MSRESFASLLRNASEGLIESSLANSILLRSLGAADATFSITQARASELRDIYVGRKTILLDSSRRLVGYDEMLDGLAGLQGEVVGFFCIETTEWTCVGVADRDFRRILICAAISHPRQE